MRQGQIQHPNTAGTHGNRLTRSLDGNAGSAVVSSVRGVFTSKEKRTCMTGGGVTPSPGHPLDAGRTETPCTCCQSTLINHSADTKTESKCRKRLLLFRYRRKNFRGNLRPGYRQPDFFFLERDDPGQETPSVVRRFTAVERACWGYSSRTAINRMGAAVL